MLGRIGFDHCSTIIHMIPERKRKHPRGLTPSVSCKHVTTAAAKPHPSCAWQLQRVLYGVVEILGVHLPAASQTFGGEYNRLRFGAGITDETALAQVVHDVPILALPSPSFVVEGELHQCEDKVACALLVKCHGTSDLPLMELRRCITPEFTCKRIK